MLKITKYPDDEPLPVGPVVAIVVDVLANRFLCCGYNHEDYMVLTPHGYGGMITFVRSEDYSRSDLGLYLLKAEPVSLA